MVSLFDLGGGSSWRGLWGRRRFVLQRLASGFTALGLSVVDKGDLRRDS
jgi:hypothetical protein